MIRNVLVYLGLRAAPSPIRRYLNVANVATAGRFGVVPMLAFAAWQNRERIAQFYRKHAPRGSARQQESTSAGATTSQQYASASAN